MTLLYATLLVTIPSAIAYLIGVTVQATRVVHTMRELGWRPPVEPGTRAVEIELDHAAAIRLLAALTGKAETIEDENS